MQTTVAQVRGSCGDELIVATNVIKTFGPVTALGGVDLCLKRGEVLGLIGENGSGKSTLTSIIAGMQRPNSGEMRFLGKEWRPQSMIDALEGGVGMIVQESGTIAGTTVAENVFLGELDRFKLFSGRGGRRFGPISRRAMNEAAERALREIGVRGVFGGTLMGALDFQTRKLVEIAKVVMKDPEVLVVDETTTALSQEGREILYGIVKRFKQQNKGVIFISHDLDEIMEVCDTLTVLRDGKYVRSFTKEQFDADDVRTSMIGRELQGDYYRSDFTPTRGDEAAIRAEGVTAAGLKGVSLTAYKGEILGVGGLSHCGMHALGKVLFGAIKCEKGRVLANGRVISSTEAAMKSRVGYVAKDRDVESLSLSASVKDNIAIAGMEKYAVGNFLVLDRREREYVDGIVEKLSVKCSDRDQLTGQLSGGNKQKVVFGKWVGRGSDVLILDCPTRGVDIGVKQAMYQLMVKLKSEGKCIVMISEELPELMGMSDRLIIMKDGRVEKEFMRSPTLTDAEIIKYMI